MCVCVLSSHLFSYIITFSYVLLIHNFLFCSVWWPCMANSVTEQYNNGGLLPDDRYYTVDPARLLCMGEPV